MFFFGAGFLVTVGSFHETLIEGAVFHGKGMANLMVDNFDQKL